MAMTGVGLGSAITDAIKAIPGINITDDSELQNFSNALGTAIVTYLQENAVVVPSALLDSLGHPVTGQGELE